jgi:hypothetical protein
MRFLLAITLFVLAQTVSPGPRLAISDARSFNALISKLMHVNMDITFAIKETASSDAALSDCLALIHAEGTTNAQTGQPIGSLVALAAQMKDPTDEVLVLQELEIFLKAIVGLVPKTREIINRTMRHCSQFAVVAIKGQAILNILTEIQQQSSTLLKAVAATNSK